MTVQIKEPADSNPATQDWQDLLLKLTLTTGGLHLFDIDTSNITNPRVRTGSRIEINGTFYRVESNEDIVGFQSIPLRSFFWVYAEVSGNALAGTSTAIFSCSEATPTWQVLKGGWFDNNNRRAMALCYRNSSGVLASWVSALGREINWAGCIPSTIDPVPTVGIIWGANTKGTWNIAHLPRGWYHAQMASGAGRGNGGDGTDTIGGGGGVAWESNSRNFFFYHDGDTPISIRVGGSGANGGRGGNGVGGSNRRTAGGGGASGGGEETALNGVSTGDIQGGNGGSATNANGAGASGGGGGGVIGGNAGGRASGSTVDNLGGGGGGHEGNGAWGVTTNAANAPGAGGGGQWDGSGHGGQGTHGQASGGIGNDGNTIVVQLTPRNGGGASNLPGAMPGDGGGGLTIGRLDGLDQQSSGAGLGSGANSSGSGGGGGGQGRDGKDRANGLNYAGFCNIRQVFIPPAA